MFFRFAAALTLVVAVSMVQVGLEKQSLRLRRSVSRQYYQMDELLELHAQLRLDIQRLSAPSRFFSASASSVELGGVATTPLTDSPPRSPETVPVRLPLLRWERPVPPDGVSRR